MHSLEPLHARGRTSEKYAECEQVRFIYISNLHSHYNVWWHSRSLSTTKDKNSSLEMLVASGSYLTSGRNITKRRKVKCQSQFTDVGGCFLFCLSFLWTTAVTIYYIFLGLVRIFTLWPWTCHRYRSYRSFHYFTNLSRVHYLGWLISALFFSECICSWI